MPVVLGGFHCSFSGLPLFLKRLVENVNWDEEKDCFEGIMSELAKLYAFHARDSDQHQHVLMTVIFPELKKENYRPSLELMRNQSVLRVELPVFRD
jgi:hypothetical protein